MAFIPFNFHKPPATVIPDLPETIDEWPKDDWKYADLEFVYPRTTDLVRRIIDATPLKGGYRRTLIDVKVQDLTPEIISCLPGWHIDGAFPQVGCPVDQHHLCVLNGPLTEFIATPLLLEVNDPKKPDMAAITRQIPSDVPVTTCAPRAITSFTSHDFHRGVRAITPTRRLLVRITETNTVLAYNHPKRPSQGARV